MFEGLWQSDEDNLHPDKYIQFDAKDNWELTSNGETIDEGYLKYAADEGEVCIYSKCGGEIDDGISRMVDDGRIDISTYGYFNYLGGRGGQWQGDGGSNWDDKNR